MERNSARWHQTNERMKGRVPGQPNRMMTSAERWASRSTIRVRGRNPVLVAVRVAQRFLAVRVTGLAAEMSYYALVSLIPLLVALGSSLGLLERIIGTEQVQAAEDTIVLGMEQVFSPEMTRDVMEPLVRGLLAEERAGAALLGLLVAFFLASAVFRAVIRALDDAYQVTERRSGLYLWGLAYLLSLGSVVVFASVLALVVVGPLLGTGQQLAEWLGVGPLFETLWLTVRWPLVVLVATAYLAWLYRVAPNVRNRWTASLPGAVAATLATILIALAFRVYLDTAGPRSPTIGGATEALQIVSRTIGAVLAFILWIWLTSVAILMGGVLNAELSRDS
jgi:membrane protein